MSEMTPRQHALRVAALDALVELAKKELTAARGDAQEAFRAVRADGQSQQRVLLPDGEDIGLISIKDGTATADITEGRLMAWCREHLPAAIEEYVDPSALGSADVIAAVKAQVPGAVRERVRPATADELLKEITRTGGWLVDRVTSEKVKVAEVTRNLPTGAFAFAGGGSDRRRQRITEEWQAGRLAEIGFGPQALAAPEPEPETDITSRLRPPFGDEHGFLNPELAAAHAVVVQGGFSTPPVEAYRMIRDGGAGAGRARAWLAGQGLDPGDPHEGKRTPWPLPAGWATPADGTPEWARVLQAGHWEHGGWTRDGRDGLLTCACGTGLSEPEKVAAT